MNSKILIFQNNNGELLDELRAQTMNTGSCSLYSLAQSRGIALWLRSEKGMGMLETLAADISRVRAWEPKIPSLF